MVFDNAVAAEFDRLEVARVGDLYRLQVDARLDVSAGAVMKTLADYRRLAEFSGAILESRVVQLPGGSARVETLSRTCVLIFCKTLRQTQTVRRDRPNRFVADVDPQYSDFRFGRIVAEVEAAGAGTRLLLHSELEPSFWVPPVLGEWIIRKALTRESRDGVLGIERVATEAPP